MEGGKGGKTRSSYHHRLRVLKMTRCYKMEGGKSGKTRYPENDKVL